MVKPLDAINVIDAFRGQHGRPDKGAIHSRLPSVSFGSLPVAIVYAGSPNHFGDTIVQSQVIKAHLRIERPLPLCPEDPFIDAGLVLALMGVERGVEMLCHFGEHIYNTNNWCEHFAHRFSDVAEMADQAPELLPELYLEAYVLLDDPEFVAVAKKKGFDGAAYGGSGESALTTEYRVFSQEQIWIQQIMDLPSAKRLLNVMSLAAAA